MQNKDVARFFSQLADLLEIQGSNAFRIRAYRNAARTIENLTESVTDIVADDPQNLRQLPGIGKDLAAKIATIVETGALPQLDELREQIPPGVVRMLGIQGIGPKKVAALFHELQVTSLEELREAAQQDHVAELKGFGQKTQALILEGIEHLEQAGQRVFLAEARPDAEAILETLAALDSTQHATIAGSCRRLKETVGDLDILVTSDDATQAMDALAEHPLVEKVLARGETKQRVRLRSGLELDLRVVPDESYGAAMQYFTGSKEHNIVVRRRAQERGLKLNEYGLFRDDQRVAGAAEQEVYAAIDLPWIPPELREDRGEFQLAEADALPALVELADLRGDLHMHTTATDGTASILEMAQAAKSRGLKYIAITDHSKRVTMANGLDADRLRAHWGEIEAVREQIAGIEILRGIECDILEDATLDLPDDVLAEADWVVAVLHYGLRQPREQINERLLSAIRNPHVDVIGHPTGRLVGTRPPADVSMDEILKAAADEGVMMEINAHPSRLDLHDVHAAAAKDLGVPIVISSDAHSTTGFDVLQWGVCQARRAGLTKKDVANTRTPGQFLKMVRRNR